jgi:hypothetical protein
MRKVWSQTRKYALCVVNAFEVCGVHTFLSPATFPLGSVMPLGSVTGFRAHTVVPVDWKVVNDEHGNRYIEGIAYNAAIKGERRRVTCSDKVWNDPDEDVFYGDEAVRWTVQELDKMKLTGIPLRVQHKDKLPAVGRVLDNWVDRDGNLHILGELDGTTKYGRTAISLVDSGACHELSIGYPLTRDPVSKEVSRLGVDEISIVTEAHFRGCKVNVKAASASDKEPARVAPYTIFSAVRATVVTQAARPVALDAVERPSWLKWVRGKERNAKMDSVRSCNVRPSHSFNFASPHDRSSNVPKRACLNGD